MVVVVSGSFVCSVFWVSSLDVFVAVVSGITPFVAVAVTFRDVTIVVISPSVFSVDMASSGGEVDCGSPWITVVRGGPPPGIGSVVTVVPFS